MSDGERVEDVGGMRSSVARMIALDHERITLRFCGGGYGFEPRFLAAVELPVVAWEAGGSAGFGEVPSSRMRWPASWPR